MQALLIQDGDNPLPVDVIARTEDGTLLGVRAAGWTDVAFVDATDVIES